MQISSEWIPVFRRGRCLPAHSAGVRLLDHVASRALGYIRSWNYCNLYMSAMLPKDTLFTWMQNVSERKPALIEQ